jgi:hypothetical protein
VPTLAFDIVQAITGRVAHGVGNMKLVAEYLADALKFERLAAQEKDEDLKLSFLQQATTYRNLAEKRAKELGKSVDDGR